MTKLRVGVIFGGKSAEHEVSLQSAKNIVDAIDKEKFDVTLLGIDKQGQWHINDASNYLLNAENPALIALNRSNKNVALILGQEKQQLIEAGSAGALGQLDVIFPIVHGTLGEDGSLQGLLRMANMPFVGADVFRQVADALRQHAIVRPCYAQQPGHPVGFSALLRKPLCQLRGDNGARELLQGAAVHLLPLEQPGVVQDIDLPSQLPASE